MFSEELKYAKATMTEFDNHLSLKVDGLCRDFPRRIQELVELEGDRRAVPPPPPGEHSPRPNLTTSRKPSDSDSFLLYFRFKICIPKLILGGPPFKYEPQVRHAIKMFRFC